MNAEQRAATWQKINELLRQHEDAQQDAVRLEIAKTWDALRQRLTVVALTETEPANGDETA